MACRGIAYCDAWVGAGGHRVNFLVLAPFCGTYSLPGVYCVPLWASVALVIVLRNVLMQDCRALLPCSASRKRALPCWPFMALVSAYGQPLWTCYTFGLHVCGWLVIPVFWSDSFSRILGQVGGLPLGALCPCC